MNYREEPKAANMFKQSYLDSINEFISKKQEEFSLVRKNNSKYIIDNLEQERTEFIKMLGWPLTEEETGPLSIERKLLANENGINIYRMKIEVFKNFYFYGLFFEHENQKLPLIISQHGAEGTPELISGIIDGGSANYNDMTERILKYGVHVFAPQLLIWNKELYGIDFNRQEIDARLKQIGSSITALEIYCLKCSISCFEKFDCVDEDKIGMVGLSYGGFYTLFTAAADTRIKSALSSCFYNDRYKYSWIDWTWKNSAKRFFDSEIALLCYPRQLCISVGKEDPAFDIKTAEVEFERLCEEICQCGINTDWLEFEVSEGGHEFCKNDSLIKKVIDKLK